MGCVESVGWGIIEGAVSPSASWLLTVKAIISRLSPTARRPSHHRFFFHVGLCCVFCTMSQNQSFLPSIISARGRIKVASAHGAIFDGLFLKCITLTCDTQRHYSPNRHLSYKQTTQSGHGVQNDGFTMSSHVHFVVIDVFTHFSLPTCCPSPAGPQSSHQQPSSSNSHVSLTPSHPSTSFNTAFLLLTFHF